MLFWYEQVPSSTSTFNEVVSKGGPMPGRGTSDNSRAYLASNQNKTSRAVLSSYIVRREWRG